MTTRQAAGMSPMEVGPRLGARVDTPIGDTPAVVTPNTIKAIMVEALGDALAQREAKRDVEFIVRLEAKGYGVPTERQRGCFAMPFHIADHMHDAMVALEGLVVIEAARRINTGLVEYYGYCADFDEVDPGDVTPAYAVAIHHENGVPVRRTFIRETT